MRDGILMDDVEASMRLIINLQADVTKGHETQAVFLEALMRIAAYDDVGANEWLAQTGSYSRFDEPGSVKVARAAIWLSARPARTGQWRDAKGKDECRAMARAAIAALDRTRL